MHDPKWCIFFDFHTMPANPDVGKGFDFDAITGQLADAGVDYMVFPARCNLGMAYYNTKVGIRHPALEYDLIGRLSAACEKRGIALTTYINIGLSHEEALLHREWCVVTEEGYTYKPNRLDHFFRQMCYGTGYADHVIEMVREVASGYPVAGFFFDCMYTSPCVGVECLREMRELGYDWQDAEQLHEYNYLKMNRMAQRLSDAARAINPELLIYCNGIDYEAQRDSGTYLEFECLPTGGWGYEALPVGARYLRTLGKPVLNMSGRFHKSWGDFGGIRTEPSLEYDLVYGLANAMRCTIGDHFHPRGDINQPVFDLYRHLYDRLRPLEPWLEGARAEVDTAVVWPMPYPGYKCMSPAKRPEWDKHYTAIKGACRMLCELKWQFDIVTDYIDWDAYDLLVLPDHTLLDEEWAERIRRHLAKGGAILSSAWSGLDPERKGFVFPEWGARYGGDDPYDPAFFTPAKGMAAGLPDMPITLYQKGTSIEPLDGAEVLGEIIAPYYNRHWDGEHGFLYMPPDKPAGRAFGVLRDRVAHFSHPLFTSYIVDGQIPVKRFVSNTLARIMSEPLVRAPGMPSFARVNVTAQPHRRMLWVMSYVPERRGDTVDMIEEPIELRDVAVSLRADGREVRSVYLAPDRQPLTFSLRDGYLHTVVPQVRGYAVVVFEE
ncbi:MAG TPA: beta-galactosidase trimerization domain-containing protein [Armatimonadota bacterium]|nr:beta-galactosidase trimerization domain-containing protein [Armatimonadota bacterium]